MDTFWAEFRYTLRRLRGQIIGWGLSLALFGLIMGILFDTMQTIQGLDELIASYPPEFMAFFGGVLSLATPQGYFGTYYASYMPLIAGVFAATVAAGLLVGDEERGTLDLTLAQPIGRGTLFWARALAFAVALAVVLLLAYLGWAITLPFSAMPVTALGLLRPFLPLWALLLLFGALALLLSLWLPSARLAAAVAGGLIVANFLLAGLANLNPDLKAVMDLTPFAFFQTGSAIDGLKWGWLLGLTGAALLLAVAAWALFLRRDIRVGGERGWAVGRLALRTPRARG